MPNCTTGSCNANGNNCTNTNQGSNPMEGIKRRQYFMDHGQMDFETQIILGSCYYGAADAGEVLSTIDRIPSGDCETWYRQWLQTAERVRSAADTSLAAGNRVSARRGYLRASCYYSAAAVFIDGTDDPSRGVSAWKEHLSCWEGFCANMEPPAEKVLIPYEGTSMPGYFFTPAKGSGPWATIIFNNGSDGPTSAMWSCGVAAALERGYAALVFDGPGQNAMLWLQKTPFRHDWEKVITPVVDFLLERSDVDPQRIALSGISQGGLWILRALAFEHRLAAGIADPAVMDVSITFMRQLPSEMRELLDTGEEEEFNQAMQQAMSMMGKQLRQTVEWRTKPYMAKSYYDQFKTVQLFNVRDVLKLIRSPVFIADPDDEQFWPGQPREVYEALDCPKTIVRFTAEEGANWHCQPKARGLYDQRMFDWLATVMPA